MSSVSLQALDEADIPALMALSLAPEQSAFVKPISEILAAISPAQRAYVIRCRQQLVGFFIIDSDYPYARELDLHDVALLRSFFIGQAYQGRGYAKQALAQLPAVLALQGGFKRFKHLALTVNCRNKAAQGLYLATDFSDSGVLYLGGPAGPQHIYVKTLA
jgi:RimJ/RimL family protein N-acetyltransferase